MLGEERAPPACGVAVRRRADAALGVTRAAVWARHRASPTTAPRSAMSAACRCQRMTAAGARADRSCGRGWRSTAPSRQTASWVGLVRGSGAARLMRHPTICCERPGIGCPYLCRAEERYPYVSTKAQPPGIVQRQTAFVHAAIFRVGNRAEPPAGLTLHQSVDDLQPALRTAADVLWRRAIRRKRPDTHAKTAEHTATGFYLDDGIPIFGQPESLNGCCRRAGGEQPE